jgi:hypothetical protein
MYVEGRSLVWEEPMQRRGKLVVLVIFTFAAMLFGLGRVVKPAQAQAQPRPPAEQPVRASVSNDLQRSVEIYGYDVAAKGGAARGEVIYYFKCWVCHNSYTIAAGSPAPSLKGLFERSNLVTGDAINDNTVAKQIRNGSPQMPSFGASLKDADIADLLTYLHDKCCYEETNPPRQSLVPGDRAKLARSPA